MFKYFGVLTLLIFAVSCGNNNTLVTYQIGGKTKKITSGQLLKDIRSLYPQVSEQDMENFLGNQDTLKLVAHSRLVEPEILTLESIKIPNFIDSAEYQENIEQQKKILPYQLAYQKGQKIVQKELQRQSVEIAEVSRIMFTNGDPLQIGEEVDGVSMVSLLEELKNSETILEDIPVMAEKYSQEPLGAQTGGYLGSIQKGQFKSLDETVFTKKAKGLYPEIVTGTDGSYIVFIHTPVQKKKVSELEKDGGMVSLAAIEVNYIMDNFEYLYTVNPETPEIYTFNKKEIAVTDIKENQKLLKVWGKSYTSKQLAPIFEILVGKSTQDYTPAVILQILSTSQQQQPISSIAQQLAIMFKGYSDSLKNSKKYKDMLKSNLDSIKLENVYQIMSVEVFKDISTNVTDSEVKEFYNNPENKQILSYSQSGTPVYATLAESKENIKQAILTSRYTLVQSQFREKIANEYSIVWNDLELIKFIERLRKDYGAYSKKNSRKQREENMMNLQ